MTALVWVCGIVEKLVVGLFGVLCSMGFGGNRQFAQGGGGGGGGAWWGSTAWEYIEKECADDSLKAFDLMCERMQAVVVNGVG